MTDDTQNTEQNQTDDQGSANPTLVLFLVIPLLGLIASLSMIAIDMRNSQNNNSGDDVYSTGSAGALINSLAPDFTLNDLNGQPVSLSDYRGKIVFLNFWQTTCPPCIEEMPDFIEFMENQPDDVTWLTVNFDETDQRVREFFAEYDFRGIPTVMDYDSAVRRQYSVFGAPVTFVIDAEGIIHYMNIGQLYYDEMGELLEAVRAGS